MRRRRTESATAMVSAEIFREGALSKIRVRLLGGFEVWHGDREVTGFESQKVRALLTYLVCNRKRAFSRDHLAGLLWPERGPEAARHALRQALYNLRMRLPGGDSAAPILLTSHLELRCNPDAECWLDVEDFEEALRRGSASEAIDPHQLSTAAQLYRGDFLAGFFVKDSPAFEDWMVAEQERLREGAIAALRVLIDSYRRRGELRFGTHYARRLVAIEPLSEEAHRDLMRLCALAGRRGRALAQYEELQVLLRTELGVEPVAETRRLYESILADTPEEAASVDDPEPIGPLVPLVGRTGTFEALRKSWGQVLAGHGHLTLVDGESGIGKTRAIKSFLDTATAQRRCTVLRGRSYELSPPIAYLPFVEILRNALMEEMDVAERTLEDLPAEVLLDLSRLLPELCDLRPELAALGPRAELAGDEGRERLFAAVARFLARFCEPERGSLGRRGQEGDPLILFLDDLHLGDPTSCEMLVYLRQRLSDLPVWFLVAYRSAELGSGHPLLAIADPAAAEDEVTRITIGRLDAGDIAEIAASLVGESGATELASFLVERSGGLPFTVVELINFLWDEGILTGGDANRWSLARPLIELALPANVTLDELIVRRIRRLPNSTRRLAALAAVAGQCFEAGLLQEAADEHGAVIEIGLEVLLKRWLLRQLDRSWTTRRRESDVALWERGARRGSFDFAHRRIRSVIYGEVNPSRRQFMHGQVAEALERLAVGKGDSLCEVLAHHYATAGLWEPAVQHFERAAERARGICAQEMAKGYYDRALEAAGRMAGVAQREDEAQRWRREGQRLAARRAEL